MRTVLNVLWWVGWSIRARAQRMHWHRDPAPVRSADMLFEECARCGRKRTTRRVRPADLRSPGSVYSTGWVRELSSGPARRARYVVITSREDSR